MVLPGESEASARAALGDAPIEFHRMAFGDVWLRDTGPIWARGPAGLVAGCFRWTGWGGKYHFPDDDGVGVRVAEHTGTPRVDHTVAIEGGAIEVDGEGTLLTTRQCILDAARNPGLAQADAEEVMARAFGATRVLWLAHALANDHTDGHIDTLCRFVAPGRVLCMAPAGPDDPNREVLADLIRELGTLSDARGRRLEVVTMPSPGRVEDARGELVAASYANYYVGNTTVVVPTYGAPGDAAAIATIAGCHPGRRTVGLSARAIIGGGGAFHCVTQQQPRRGAS